MSPSDYDSGRADPNAAANRDVCAAWCVILLCQLDERAPNTRPWPQSVRFSLGRGQSTVIEGWTRTITQVHASSVVYTIE